MKILEVKKEKFEKEFPDLEEVSLRLDKHRQKEPVDILNWENFTFRPEVWFTMAYSGREIFLKFYVTEEFIKAEKTESNQMVCEDSCVEFFVSPSEDGIYYNFEFNPIGTCLLGTGTCREDSSLAPVSVIERIRRKGSSGTKPFKERRGEFSWTITIAIPLETFFRHDLKEFNGKTFRANFYKCGDMLTSPHYLTWNSVGTKNPDYHQPEYFGLLNFV
jgi:hypothetical protein